MRETEFLTRTIGDIVTQDFRTATVFKEAGIDFCCGGKKTVEEACSEKGIDPEKLQAQLDQPEKIAGAVTHKFNEWEPGFLCDYIVNEHHSFVRKALPDLVHYTQKIASVHGRNHPELIDVAGLFFQINKELLQHMKKEEEILFPAVKELFSAGTEKSKETIINELSLLSEEHEFAGGAMDKINQITSGYSLPEDACNSYRISFQMLEQFEDDLHTHVHLENNILFPKALERIN